MVSAVILAVLLYTALISVLLSDARAPALRLSPRVSLKSVDAPEVALAAHGLVLSVASNVNDVLALQRFVSSSRLHSPSSAIVLFMDALSIERHPRLNELFDTFDVDVVLFDLATDLPTFPFGPQEAWVDIYRWILYDRYMTSLALRGNETFDYVFFADSRDTVFQADIFAEARSIGSGFFAVMESIHETIGGSELNSLWVSDCYGEQNLTLVADKAVSNSGSTLASWDDARVYARLMVDTMTALAAPKCLWSDQGILNYLLHTGVIASLVSAVHLVTHEEGFVVSLGTAPFVRLDLWGRVLNSAGVLAACVHQYDRWPMLTASFEARLPWIAPNDVWINRDRLALPLAPLVPPPSASAHPCVPPT